MKTTTNLTQRRKHTYSSRQIVCEVCHQVRRTQRQKRNICYTCYEKEKGKKCIRCKRIKRKVSEENNLCPQCMEIENRPIGVCKGCNENKIILNQEEWLCDQCNRKQTMLARGQKRPKNVICCKCQQLCNSVLFSRNICSPCWKLERNGIKVCSRCGEAGEIQHKEKQLCNKCASKRRYEKLSQKRVNCSACGKECFSHLASRNICDGCYRKEKNGIANCKQCKREKTIYSKELGLCAHCYRNRLAPTSLKKYLKEFTSPYAQNEHFLQLLAKNINWESVNEFEKQSFRYFGDFLQTYKLPQKLTWEEINEAMPSLEEGSRVKNKAIRAFLVKLGEFFVSRGELESRDDYLGRREVLEYIDTAPTHFRLILKQYATNLWERKYRSNSILTITRTLVPFLRWCNEHSIKSVTQIGTQVVSDYIKVVHQSSKCSNCGFTSISYSALDEESTIQCSHCYSFDKHLVERTLSQESLARLVSALRNFFDWAKLNRLVVCNPIILKSVVPKPVIRHCSLQDVQKLLKYVKDEQADPEEAFLIYLIVCHAFSIWELRHAQIPFVYPLGQTGSLQQLSDAYCVYIIQREPSRGDHSPNRPNIRVHFPESVRPWLYPLLRRFEQKRLQKVPSDIENQYLFTVPNRSEHSRPASQKYISRLIAQVTEKVLGQACTGRLLRFTSGVMFVDLANDPSILTQMGWGGAQAFFYSWGPRKELSLQKSLD